jgi:hypothetical protein
MVVCDLWVESFSCRAAESKPDLARQPDIDNTSDTWNDNASEKTAVQKFLYPDEEDLPSNFEVSAATPWQRIAAATAQQMSLLCQSNCCADKQTK